MNASHFFASACDEELAIVIGRVLDFYRDGIHRGRAAGSGIDFKSIRERDPSDPIAKIDRIVSSRPPYHPILRPVVRTYDAEKEVSVLVVIDAGRSMTIPKRKLEYAARLLWLWAFSAFKTQDSFRALIFSESACEDSGRVRSEETLQAALRYTRPDSLEKRGGPYRYLTELSPADTLLIVISDFARLTMQEVRVLRNLSVYERNIEILFFALDEWWGFKPTGYGVEVRDTETGVGRMMSDRDIQHAARAAANQFASIQKELAPFSGTCIEVPLVGDPITVVVRELLRIGFVKR